MNEPENVLVGVIASDEEWMAADAALLYQTTARNSQWRQVWVSCFDLKKYVKEEHELVHLWRGSIELVFGVKHETFYDLISKSKLLRKLRAVIREEVAIAALKRSRLLISFHAHGYSPPCNSREEAHRRELLRAQHPVENWPSGWGSLEIGNKLYSNDQLTLDLMTLKPNTPEADITCFFLQCFAGKFKRSSKGSMLAASDLQYSFSHAITGTGRKRAPGGVYLGNLMREACNRETMSIEQLIAIVERRTVQDTSRWASTIPGFDRGIVWHQIARQHQQVVVSDLIPTTEWISPYLDLPQSSNIVLTGGHKRRFTEDADSEYSPTPRPRKLLRAHSRKMQSRVIELEHAENARTVVKADNRLLAVADAACLADIDAHSFADCIMNLAEGDHSNYVSGPMLLHPGIRSLPTKKCSALLRELVGTEVLKTPMNAVSIVVVTQDSIRTDIVGSDKSHDSNDCDDRSELASCCVPSGLQKTQSSTLTTSLAQTEAHEKAIEADCNLIVPEAADSAGNTILIGTDMSDVSRNLKNAEKPEPCMMSRALSESNDSETSDEEEEEDALTRQARYLPTSFAVFNPTRFDELVDWFDKMDICLSEQRRAPWTRWQSLCGHWTWSKKNGRHWDGELFTNFQEKYAQLEHLRWQAGRVEDISEWLLDGPCPFLEFKTYLHRATTYESKFCSEMIGLLAKHLALGNRHYLQLDKICKVLLYAFENSVRSEHDIEKYVRDFCYA